MKYTASFNQCIQKKFKCIVSQQMNDFIHHYCPCVITQQPTNKQDKINNFLLNRI